MPGSGARPCSMLRMQPPQWMVGSEISVCCSPSPSAWLASRISSRDGAVLPVSDWLNSPPGRQQLMISGRLTDRLVGMPGRMPDQREDDQQAQQAGDQTEQEQRQHDEAPGEQDG